MRRIIVLVAIAALGVGCGGDQPPPVPESATASPRPPSAPPSSIPAPTAAELHGVPLSNDEDLQELYDLSRDVLAVARSESGAVADLATDLSRWESGGGTGPNAKALAESVGTALAGGKVDDASARRVAVLLYVAMNGSKITAEQRTAAAAELRQTLTSVGAPAAQADAVSAHLR